MIKINLKNENLLRAAFTSHSFWFTSMFHSGYLFLVYINDLYVVKHRQLHHFADAANLLSFGIAIKKILIGQLRLEKSNQLAFFKYNLPLII